MNKYLVWSPDEDQSADDGVEICAFGADHAAEDWARRRDMDDPCDRISDGVSVRVRVRELASGAESTWALSGEYEPIYDATEVDDET